MLDTWHAADSVGGGQGTLGRITPIIVIHVAHWSATARMLLMLIWLL
ncbi:uncharacterized protein METZ01_LOCUS363835 [marine metagenome]|uniref:Uncharacterized protein n=1 Tax=marine metagenome TaxID=408172 RepID=A0A382SQ05_9ZZZZ